MSWFRSASADESRINSLAAVVKSSHRPYSDNPAQAIEQLQILQTAANIDAWVQTRAEELEVASTASFPTTEGNTSSTVSSWLVAIADTILRTLGQDPLPEHHQDRMSQSKDQMAAEIDDVFKNRRLDRNALFYTFWQSAGLKNYWRSTRAEGHRPKEWDNMGVPRGVHDGRCEKVWLTELERVASEEFNRTRRR